MDFFTIILTLLALWAGNETPLVLCNSHGIEESQFIRIFDSEDTKSEERQFPNDEQLATVRNGAENQYWLFTRNNPTNGQILINGNIFSILLSNYRGNRPTKIVVHGWDSNSNDQVNQIIRSAFLDVGDFNVISVDWHRLASNPYLTAVNGVPDVGNHLGSFLLWLFAVAGGNWNQLHLVGYSLGAHVVGNAGRTINGLASRVTGLDPAGAPWNNNPNALNQNSGAYVESIHTDGGVLGIFDAISHADFYSNGGVHPQPGCLNNACSHNRATELFAASVRFDHLIGKECPNINQLNNCTGSILPMGNADLTKRGTGLYGLTTENNWPF